MARPSPPASAPAPAKFLPPRPRHPLARPRLHALLDDAAPARAIWLQGQAGAGKSTLAAAWAAQRAPALAWYRVDATDGDPHSACATLAALLGRLVRRRLPADVLQPPPRGDDELARQAHARRFFRAFHAAIAPALLVLDDVHAAPSPAFQALLQAAVDEATPERPLMVTSRQPPQGALLEALARGELWVLPPTALDFTAEEATALLAPRLGEQRAQQLHARTGGWAAGLTLLAAQPDAADQAEQTVADFFSQRVLGLLDAPQRQLLAAVSLLPEVDQPALQVLGLDDGAADQLDQLCAQLGFVQRLRHGQRCWRVHDLLRQSVQAHWPTLGSPAWRQATQQAAAGVHAGQGRLQAALALLAAAGLPDAALALWLQQAPRLLQQGRAQELHRAFAELAQDQAARHSRALMLRGLAAWLNRDTDTGDWFNRAWAALDAAAQPAASVDRLIAAAAALNAQFSSWRSFAGREDWQQRFLAAWPARAGLADAGDGLRADNAALLCFLTHRLAPLDEADRQPLLDRVLAALAQPAAADDTTTPAALLDPNVAVSASAHLVEWCNYTGDRLLLSRLADLTPPWLGHPGLGGTTQAAWWISYGWVSTRLATGRSDLPEGEAAVERGVALARDSGAPEVAFYGWSNLAAAAMSRGALDLADQRLQQLQQAAEQRTGSAVQPTQQATLHVLAARLLCLRGDPATALVRMQRALELAQAADFPPSETWIHHLGHVQVLTALGQEDDAARLAQAQAGHYDGLRHDFLLALGLLAQLAQAWREGREPADEAIRHCTTLAARHAWTALGNHLPATVARLAAAALALGHQRDFVTAMIRQRRLPPPQPDVADWPWPLRVCALGGFAVLADEVALDFGARPQKKPLDLLRLLVAWGPAPLDTARVTDALWPEADGDRAKASLDMAVLRLRKLLGHDEALRLEHGRLGLNRRLVWVDSWAWLAGQPLPYAGRLFGDAPVELAWAAQREALHSQFLRRSHQQAGALERSSRWADALACYESALTHDALDEALHRGAIRCLLALGEPAAAHRALARCRQQLRAGLGVAPAAATLALLSGVAAGG